MIGLQQEPTNRNLAYIKNFPRFAGVINIPKHIYKNNITYNYENRKRKISTKK